MKKRSIRGTRKRIFIKGEKRKGKTTAWGKKVPSQYWKGNSSWDEEFKRKSTRRIKSVK